MAVFPAFLYQVPKGLHVHMGCPLAIFLPWDLIDMMEVPVWEPNRLAGALNMFEDNQKRKELNFLAIVVIPLNRRLREISPN